MPKISENLQRPELRTPQARVLSALAAEGLPALTRQEMAESAGFSPLSGTVWRALNGLPEGSSSGDAHAGLLRMGMVVELTLDIDGIKEVRYRITLAGLDALRRWQSVPMRSKERSTNKRYKRGSDA